MANGESGGRLVFTHPAFLTFAPMLVTALITLGISWQMVQGNKENIDKMYTVWDKSLESQRRESDAWRAGIDRRLQLLENNRGSASFGGSIHYAHLQMVADKAPPAPKPPRKPPPDVPERAKLFDERIAALRLRLDILTKRKKFTEMNDKEQDEVLDLQLQLGTARAWQAWCEIDYARKIYCLDKFIVP